MLAQTLVRKSDQLSPNLVVMRTALQAESSSQLVIA